MPRTLLAIESATDWLSVALLRGEEVIDVEAPEGTRQHAAALMPAIDRVLRRTETGLDDIDALAVSTGPGSFTSLRIGLATVKGLAFGRDFVAAGVSTLEAMAFAILEAGSAEADRQVVALLDARRGEWYAGGWHAPDSPGALPRPGLPEGLYAPEQLARDLSGALTVVCPEPSGWQAELEAAGVQAVDWISGAAARPHAVAVGRLAVRRLARGEGLDPRWLAARYLRRAEAEAKRLGGPVEAGELARVEPPSG